MDEGDVEAIIDRLSGVEALLEGREEFHEAVLRMNRSGRRSRVAFPSLSGFLATAQFLLQFSYPGLCGVGPGLLCVDLGLCGVGPGLLCVDLGLCGVGPGPFLMEGGYVVSGLGVMPAQFPVVPPDEEVQHAAVAL
jgi:hypothetical protein